MECSHGTRCRYTASSTARGHISVTRGLLQFLNLVVDDLYIYGTERLSFYRHNAVLPKIATNVDEILAEVGIFFLIHISIFSDKVSRCCISKHILHNCSVSSVNVSLCILAHINVSKACDSSLNSKERVNHEGIQTVVIPSSLCIGGVVLGCEKHLVIDKLAVVEYRLAVYRLLVVPIHHRRLRICVNLVIINILGHINSRASKPIRKLRICLNQKVIVHQLNVEYITALLNVHNTGLPKEIDDVYLSDRNITESVQFGIVPKDAVHTCSRLELVVLHIGVGLLKLILIEDNGNDGRKHLSLCLISLLTGKDIGRGEIVHCGGVFIRYTVEEPCRGRLNVILLVSHTLPMTELVPLLVVNDFLLKVGFAFLVLVKSQSSLLHLLLADGLSQCHNAIQGTVSISALRG